MQNECFGFFRSAATIVFEMESPILAIEVLADGSHAAQRYHHQGHHQNKEVMNAANQGSRNDTYFAREMPPTNGST